LGEVISFVSGKGGTGKSALCAGIATVLATSGKRVLCIDADVGLRNLDLFLGLGEVEALSFLDVCSGSYPLSVAAEHPKFPNLYVLTAPVNCDAEEIDPQEFSQLVRNARDLYDFVLIDGAAGLGAKLRLVSQPADRCVVVALPDPASIRSADRCAQELEKMGAKNCRLVVNRLYNDPLKVMNKTIDDIMDEVGLPLLGIVPTDPNVTLACAAGKPLCKYTHFGAAAAHKRIAKRILGLNVAISR
jgi:septum site-determining protein MinD